MKLLNCRRLSICLCDMNHYSDFDETLAKWNERKQKINWDNLFVVMFTDNKSIPEQFDEFPYGKKVRHVALRQENAAD